MRKHCSIFVFPATRILRKHQFLWSPRSHLIPQKNYICQMKQIRQRTLEIVTPQLMNYAIHNITSQFYFLVYFQSRKREAKKIQPVIVSKNPFHIFPFSFVPFTLITNDTASQGKRYG